MLTLALILAAKPRFKAPTIAIYASITKTIRNLRLELSIGLPDLFEVRLSGIAVDLGVVARWYVPRVPAISSVG